MSRLRHVGSAHVLAALALFVALGGTAMANDAVRAFITGAHVRDGRSPAENGEALRAALASITDASATKPYVIQLAPGIYELGHETLAMKPDVSIAGAGAAVTRITGDQGQPTLGGALVLGADRTLLRDVTVVNRGDMAAHFHTAMAVLGGAAMRIEDAVVEGGGSSEPGSGTSLTRRTVVAVSVAGGSDVRIRGSEIAANSEVSPIALQVRDDGSTAVVENSALVSPSRALTAGLGSTATVGASRVEGGGSGSVICAASYDGGFVPVDAGCN